MEQNAEFIKDLRNLLIDMSENTTDALQKEQLQVALAILKDFEHRKANKEQAALFFKIAGGLLRATAEGSIIGFFASMGGH